MDQAIAFELEELPGAVYRVSSVRTVAPPRWDDLVDVDCGMTRDASARALLRLGIVGRRINRIMGRPVETGVAVVALVCGQAG